MGLLPVIQVPLGRLIEVVPLWQLVFFSLAASITLAILLNILHQLVFKNPNEPPVVFHWLPIIGNTLNYGMDPFKFFHDCRGKVPYPDPVGQKVRSMTRF